MADTEARELKTAKQRPFAVRVGEAAVFIGVILILSLAIIAVAVAAPVVLGVTALAGFFTRRGSARRWRPVGA